MKNELAWICAVALLIPSAAAAVEPRGATPFTEAQNRRVEVTVLESEVGLDDLIPNRDDPRVRAALRDAEMAKTSANHSEEEGGPRLQEDQVMHINRSLQRMIEANAELERRYSEIDREVRDMRGQRNIDRNRLNTLRLERDAYRRQLEEAAAIRKEADTMLANFTVQASQREQDLKAQISKLEQELEEKTRLLGSAPDGREKALRDEVSQLKEQLQKQSQALSSNAGSGERERGLMRRITALQEELGEKTRLLAAGSSGVEREKELMDRIATLKKQLQDKSGERSREKELMTQVASLQLALDKKTRDLEALTEGSPSKGEMVQSKMPEKMSRPEAAKAPAQPRVEPATMAAEMPAVPPPLHPTLPSSPVRAVPGGRPDLEVLTMLDELTQKNKQLIAAEASIHYEMGNRFFKNGEYIRAIDEYKQAVRLVPEDPNAHFNLAFVSDEYMHDKKMAVQHYRSYLYLRPEAEDAELVRSRILAAELYLQVEIHSPMERKIQNELKSIHSVR